MLNVAKADNMEEVSNGDESKRKEVVPSKRDVPDQDEAKRIKGNFRYKSPPCSSIFVNKL